MQTEARCHHQGPPHFSLQQPGTAVSVKTLVLPQGFSLFGYVFYSLTREPFSYIAKNCVKAKAFSANQFGVSKITTKGQNGGLQYIDQCSYSKDAICVRYSLLNICHNRSNLRNTQNQGSSIHCISTRTKEEIFWAPTLLSPSHMAGRSPRNQATRIVGIKVKGTFEEYMRMKNQRRLKNVNQVKKGYMTNLWHLECMCTSF